MMTSSTNTAPRYRRPIIHETIEEPTLLREMLQQDIYLLGGQFAILCQWAHPGLAKGSYSRSNFASRVLGRLQNTARFLNVSVYGTREEQEAIFSVIHKYHASVNGPGYDANDPELHKWTAATLFVSLLVVQELILGKLPPEKTETLFRQCAIWGTSLNMTPDMWPATLAEFWEYWNHNIETLQVTDEARKLSQDLLYPSNLPLEFQAFLPLTRLITCNLLPPRLAREYRVEPTAINRATFQGVTLWLAWVYPWLPQSLRSRRHQLYMEDLQRAIAKIQDTGHWVGVKAI